MREIVREGELERGGGRESRIGREGGRSGER